MEDDEFLLIPFYKYIYTILPRTELHAVNSNLESDKHDLKGYHYFDFSLKDFYNVSEIKSNEEMKARTDYRVVIKMFSYSHALNNNEDLFPPFLKVTVNNCQKHLSDYLPYDNERMCGRRFARPIDITDSIIFDHDNKNQCILKWGHEFCDRKFSFAICVVKFRSSEELSSEILNKSANQVSEIQIKFLTSSASIISLICPLSLCRIEIPVRGTNCDHLQCFNFVSYLTINFQKPNWICPICGRKTVYNDLTVDSFIFGIINDKRSNLIKDIEINNEGQWKPLSDLDSKREHKSATYVSKVNKRKFVDDHTSDITIKKRCNLLQKDFPNKTLSNRTKSKVPLSMNLTNSLYEYNHNDSNIIYDLPSPVPEICENKISGSSFPFAMHLNSNSVNISEICPTNSSSAEIQTECDKENLIIENLSQSDVNPKVPANQFQSIPSTELEYRMVIKEASFYQELEKYISSANKDITTFVKPEDIPNSLKEEATEKRKLVLLRMEQNSMIRISLFNPKSEDIEIHAGKKPLELYIDLEKENVRYSITLDAYSSINFICHNNWENRIQLSFNDNEKSTAALEMYEKENEKEENSPECLFDWWLRDNTVITENKSFLRKTLPIDAIRRKIRFLDVKSGLGKYCQRFLPLAAVVLDYDGNELFREKITPRGFVTNYRPEINGLSETDVIGCFDEEQCSDQLRKILQDSIVVGFKVIPALFCLRVELERIFGIRDLSTGLCFDGMRSSGADNCLYTLKYLASNILDRDIQVEPGQFLFKENVTAIRDIYLAIENQWVDHINPDGSHGSVKRTVNFTNSIKSINSGSQLLRNKIVQYKALDEELMSEFDLGDVPDIEIMEVDDVNLLNEMPIKQQNNNDDLPQVTSNCSSTHHSPVTFDCSSTHHSPVTFDCSSTHHSPVTFDCSSTHHSPELRVTNKFIDHKISKSNPNSETGPENVTFQTFQNKQDSNESHKELMQNFEIIDQDNCTISETIKTTINYIQEDQTIEPINNCLMYLSESSPKGIENISTSAQDFLNTSGNPIILVDSGDEECTEGGQDVDSDNSIIFVDSDEILSNTNNELEGFISMDNVENDDDINIVEIEDFDSLKLQPEIELKSLSFNGQDQTQFISNNYTNGFSHCSIEEPAIENVLKTREIQQIETVIVDKNQFPSLKIQDKNGNSNYLISGIFYCPERNVWTKLQLDADGISELKRSITYS